MTTFIIEIEQENGKYLGKVYKDNRDRFVDIEELNLSTDHQVHHHPEKPSLGYLCNLITDYNKDGLIKYLDVRGQLELGCFLFDETLGRYLKLSHSNEDVLNPSEPVQVHIVSQDEFILRLPWVLLAHKYVFLSTCNWHVALSDGNITRYSILPVNPRLLVIAPNNKALTDTEANAHLHEIEKELLPSDSRLVRGDHITLTTTWQETQDALDKQAYHLIYYYGHGEGDSKNSLLCFGSKNSEKISMALFAQKIKSVNERHQCEPQLIYLNCCGADAGGALGAGAQLIQMTSAVMSNRTTCVVSAARAFGKQFLRAILVEGIAPHEAENGIYQGVADNNLRLSDIRWITPVLWRRYGKWSSNPQRHQEIADPHWRLKLDRTPQFSQISYRMQLMLSAKKPRGLCYFWHGEKGQGVEIFHRRVPIELEELNTDLYVHDLEVSWPDYHADNNDFEHMIATACQCNSLDNTIDQMRAWQQRAGARNFLVYFHHLPMQKHQTKMLLPYMKWWDGDLLPRLREANAYGLLGLSVEGNDTAKAAKVIKQKIDLEALNNSVFNLLPELTSITRQDLFDFLNTHNIVIREDIIEEILTDVLEIAAGKYEQTLEALKDIISKARDKAENIQKKDKKNNDEDGDWAF